MSISLTCRHCQTSLRLKDEYAGKQGKCPKCKQPIRVPAAANRGTVALVSTEQVDAPVKSSVATRHVSSAAVSSSSEAEATANALSAARSPQLAQQILNRFQSRIEPVPVPLTYRLGIMLVAAVMVVLPLLYLAMVFLVGYVLYLHAVYDTWLLLAGRGFGRVVALALYAAPLAAGALLIFFMIKPLLARPEKVERRRSLTRSGEPLLFAFVDRVCMAVGAPQPKRIDVNCEVNASASFRRGLLSFLGNDLVLTVGLPLAAGLSLTQFAGILAHEFGHFTQGFGMRLTYVVRSINWWFTRVVYERDQWDAWLIESTENSDSWISLILYLARFFVWTTRKLLWVLMVVGHAVSGFLMRQMEYDADRHQVRLVGSDSMLPTMRQVALLSVATHGAYSDLSDFYREGRLGDDLPQLIVANLPQIPAPLKQEIEQSLQESRTGLFDTHPAEKDRIASARREGALGVVHFDGPASGLFTDFKNLSRNATWDFYRGVFGPKFKQSDMHPVETLIAGQQEEHQKGKTLGRYFQGMFRKSEPLRLTHKAPAAPNDPRESLAVVKQCRQRIVDARQDEGRPASPEWQQQGFPETGGRRLFAALELLFVKQVAAKISDAADLQNECSRIYPVFLALAGQIELASALGTSHSQFVGLVEQLQQGQPGQMEAQNVYSLMGQMYTQLRRLHQAMNDVPYPLPHGQGQITVSRYLLKEMPGSHDAGAIFAAAGDLLESFSVLYIKLASRLATIAEQVEMAVGLEPLPEYEGSA